jgi:transposase InsO family protein
VYGVLRGAGLSVLAPLDRTTRSVIRYERPRTGEVIHLDIKKLAGIPDGGGKRVQPGWQEAKTARRTSRGGGRDHPHVAIDNHSRYAYAEALPDEKWITAADFLLRAALAFAQVGIAVERVITDNGGCYRSHAFTEAASMLEVKLKRTCPCRPQTNGKAEVFKHTLRREWAYLRPYYFLQDYNYARPHTSTGNKPAASLL